MVLHLPIIINKLNQINFDLIGYKLIVTDVAEQGDCEEMRRLLKVMERPDEQPGMESMCGCLLPGMIMVWF